MNHTPGPWRMEQSQKYHSIRVVGADNKPVASFGNQARWIGYTQMLANARLIAAAPELLEACEMALNTLNGLAHFLNDVEQDTIEYLLLAIAKARGRHETGD